MPAVRARDHGIVIGRLGTGPANAITDVPGVVVGHASHAPDNTGVTVIVPRAGSDTWLEPVYAGVAVLNGAGELTGSIQIREWGVMETPVFLTATPYVGAVYHAATQVLGRAPAGHRRRRRDHPRGRRVRQLGRRRRRARARRPTRRWWPRRSTARGAGAGRRGTGRRRHRHALLRLRGRHRHRRRGRSSGYTVGVLLLVNFGDWEELRIAGRLAGVPAPTRGVDGLVHRRRRHRRAAAAAGPRAPRAPGVPRPRAGRLLRLERLGRDRDRVLDGQRRLHAPRRARRRAARSCCAPRTQHSWLFAACTEAAEEAVINALLGAHTLVGPARHGATRSRSTGLPA